MNEKATDSEFLNWLADRLVHVYGENPNVDFVHVTRRIADALASPEAIIQDAKEQIEHLDVENHRLRREMAALASPQVARAPEPVAQVESWTNGSYSRNYKIKWLKDVPEGAFLYLAAPVQVAPAAIDFAKPLETTEGEPVKHICHDVIQYRSAQVCIDKSTGRSYSGPYPGLTIRNVAAPMQPGAAADDARDAARLANAFREGWVPFLIRDANRVAELLEILSGPAAKPAEEE